MKTVETAPESFELILPNGDAKTFHLLGLGYICAEALDKDPVRNEPGKWRLMLVSPLDGSASNKAYLFVFSTKDPNIYRVAELGVHTQAIETSKEVQ